MLAMLLAQQTQRGSLGVIEAKCGKVLGCERAHGSVSPGCLNGAIIALEWGIVVENTSLASLAYPLPTIQRRTHDLEERNAIRR